MTAPSFRSVCQLSGDKAEPNADTGAFFRALSEADGFVARLDNADQLDAENHALRAELTVADAEIDRLTDITTQAFAAAVGHYTCPCGSSHEFTADGTLEDYAGLQRWLGRHVGNDEHDAYLSDPDKALLDAVVDLSRKHKRDNEALRRHLQRAEHDREMLRRQSRALLDRLEPRDVQ